MQNMNLEELVNRTEYVKNNRADYVVAVESISAENTGGDLRLKLADMPNNFGVTEFAHEQIAEKLQIPYKYYNRMRTGGKTDLLVNNVNTWLSAQEDRNKLIRTVDGNVRAFVTSKFRCLDNSDVLFLALDKLKEYDAVVNQAFVDDRHMYLKAYVPSLEREVVPKDIIKAGIIIRNSEVGAGALRVEPFVYRVVCQNGMIADRIMRQVHIGDDKAVGFQWSDDTIASESATTWLKVRDMIELTFEGEFLNTYLEEAKLAVNTKIRKPIEVVDRVSADLKLSEEVKKNIMNHFIFDGDVSVWGLANAITKEAQERPTVLEQVDLEAAGYRVMRTLPKTLTADDIVVGYGVSP